MAGLVRAGHSRGGVPTSPCPPLSTSALGRGRRYQGDRLHTVDLPAINTRSAIDPRQRPGHTDRDGLDAGRTRVVFTPFAQQQREGAQVDSGAVNA